VRWGPGDKAKGSIPEDLDFFSPSLLRFETICSRQRNHSDYGGTVGISREITPSRFLDRAYGLRGRLKFLVSSSRKSGHGITSVNARLLHFTRRSGSRLLWYMVVQNGGVVDLLYKFVLDDEVDTFRRNWIKVILWSTLIWHITEYVCFCKSAYIGLHHLALTFHRDILDRSFAGTAPEEVEGLDMHMEERRTEWREMHLC
jgi:hypothetical protein